MRRERILEWLAARRPAVPLALEARLRRAVAEADTASLEASLSVAGVLSAIGLRLLTDVTNRGVQDEAMALDLLAADAFVTYAVEAAAEEGISAGPFARDILHAAMAG